MQINSGLKFNEKLFYTLDHKRTERYSVSVWTFPGGEVGVNINTASLHWSDTQAKVVGIVTIVARVQSSEDLVALLSAKDALSRVYTMADIELILPYIPYARQDRVCVPGEALGARVFADIINGAGFSRVTSLDPHSPTSAALITGCNFLGQTHVFKGVKQDWHKWTIVAPDMGAAKKCEDFAREVGAKGVVYFDKVRELSTGKIKQIKLLGDKPIAQKLFVLDDIVDAGRTFLGMVPQLHGNRVELAVSHGIFSAGTEILTNVFDHVYTTDSWNPYLASSEKLTVIKM